MQAVCRPTQLWTESNQLFLPSQGREGEGETHSLPVQTQQDVLLISDSHLEVIHRENIITKTTL